MMSVHDALEAWQAGEITTSRAMALSGASDVLELYAFASACDVGIRLDPTPEEAAMVTKVSEAISRAMNTTSDGPKGADGIRAA